MTLRFLLLALAFSLPAAAQTTYTVTTAADAGAGSLREAIESANANPGADVIAFAIDGGGAYAEIFVESQLPFLTDPVTIDGSTQGCDTAGGPCVRIDGGGIAETPTTEPASGLIVYGGSSTIHGLLFTRFFPDGYGSGVRLASPDNVVTGCFFGTDRAGSTTDPDGTPDSGDELGNAFGASVGWYTFDDAGSNPTENRIGGDTPADRNVMAGSTYSGVLLRNGDGALVAGNYIGTDATGSSSLGNGEAGVLVGGGSVGAVIEGNVLSGNVQTGIVLQSEATGSVIRDNFIGTDATGSAAVPNGTLAELAELNGIGIELRSTVGTVIEGNVVSGNLLAGIALGGAAIGDGEDPPSVTGARVVGNLIGTDADGTAPLPNGVAGIPDVGFGIVLFAAPGISVAGNQIGGPGEGEANVIAHNTSAGIGAEGPGVVGNTIDGNLIGVDADADPAPNGQVGILFRNGPAGNRIGTTDLDGEGDFPGNYIAFQPLGVALGDFTGGNDIVYNTFAGAPGAYLPVDLGANGPTANDAGDPDEGPNRVQNTPEILATPVDGSDRLVVRYRVDTAMGNATYPLTVRFYGQGIEDGLLLHVPFGSATYAAPGVAEATFDNPFDGPAVIVATATDADGNTGEVTLAGVPVMATAAPAAGAAVRIGPNPTAGPFQAAFTLAAPAEATLTVYDVLGREVAATAPARLGTGPQTVGIGAALPAGVYVWRLTLDDRVETGRVTVAR